MPPTARVFELRTYRPAPGKLEALQRRFRDHTMALFATHGFTVVGFWTDVDGGVDADLVYLLAWESRSAADKVWDAFRADPAWIAAKADSEVDGPLTANIDAVFMTPTDYSPLA